MPKRRPANSSRNARSRSGVRVEKSKASGEWMLVHPRGVRDRSDDMEEVQTMLEAGELDIAIDELRWLLGGCPDFIEAHQLLGVLALSADNDVPLARGHFGFAYDIGRKAIRQAGDPAPLRQSQPANQAFFAAGQGLAFCLLRQEKQQQARQVIEQLLHCDPSDPLALRAMAAGEEEVQVHQLEKWPGEAPG